MTEYEIAEEQAILNQLTCFQDITFETMGRLEAKMSEVIDSTWHYSWHWDRSPNGYYLTPKGYETALKDGIDLRDSLQKHVDALNKIIPQIESVVRRNKLRQRLDEIYEKEDANG